MNWLQKAALLDITIENDCWDSHRGEVFCALLARFQGQPVGGLKYSIYEGVYDIKNMRVLPDFRRQGVATQLMRRLEQMAAADGGTVNRGMSTPDGTAFLESYDKEQV
jgi:GNAT superfamily N-acetyltransferase